MSITLFGIFWISVILVCLKKAKIKYFIFFTLLSMIFQCDNVIVIAGIGVGPQLITSTVFILFSFLMKPMRHERLHFRTAFFFFSSFLLYISLNSFFREILGNNILNILQIAIYLLCALRLYDCRKGISEIEYYKYVTCVIKFVACFAPIQLLATYDVIPRDLLTPFFFNDLGEAVYFHYPERYRRLLATFLEPSFCSPFLVGSIFFIYHLRDKIKQSTILLIILFIELLLTTSSTGYGTFAIMLLLYYWAFANKKTYKSYLLLLLLFAIVYFSLDSSLIQEVIVNKSESDSGKFRNMQNLNALYAFWENKQFGIGFGKMRSSSLAYTMLAELGIWGVVLFLCFCIPILWSIIGKGRYNRKEIASCLFVLSVILSQLIAVPDLQFCVFWFGIYLLALSPDLSYSRNEVNNKAIMN